MAVSLNISICCIEKCKASAGAQLICLSTVIYGLPAHHFSLLINKAKGTVSIVASLFVRAYVMASRHHRHDHHHREELGGALFPILFPGPCSGPQSSTVVCSAEDISGVWRKGQVNLSC